LGFTENECILKNDTLGYRFYTDRENESEAENILNQINGWDALQSRIKLKSKHQSELVKIISDRYAGVTDKLESENKKLREALKGFTESKYPIGDKAFQVLLNQAKKLI